MGKGEREKGNEMGAEILTGYQERGRQNSIRGGMQ